jgi:hypothetical protein
MRPCCRVQLFWRTCRSQTTDEVFGTRRAGAAVGAGRRVAVLGTMAIGLIADRSVPRFGTGAATALKPAHNDHWALPMSSRTPSSARVRRQGLEPRTRGLRVRCSAIRSVLSVPSGAGSSGTSPIRLPGSAAASRHVSRHTSNHRATTVPAVPSLPTLGRGAMLGAALSEIRSEPPSPDLRGNCFFSADALLRSITQVSRHAPDSALTCSLGEAPV